MRFSFGTSQYRPLATRRAELRRQALLAQKGINHGEECAAVRPERDDIEPDAELLHDIAGADRFGRVVHENGIGELVDRPKRALATDERVRVIPNRRLLEPAAILLLDDLAIPESACVSHRSGG
jgi:hypothetical protein